VLVECARRLQALAGPEDLVARLGGDEFVVVLPGEGDRTTAAAAGRRMIGALGLPVTLAGQELWLTCSVGACRAPEQGMQPATLLRRADLAMYRAKTRGGNRVELHAELVEELGPGPLQLERDLHGIARRNELELWYQPITRLADDRCVGMEALLRWRHPRHGLLVPDRFLPVAEQTDLMPALGSWVLGAACEQAARWEPLTRPGPFNISVNLSARQFDPTLVAQVGDVLRTSGLEPSALTLEITETMVLQPGDDTLGVLRGLRGLGVGIATDDFGTGYTSLEQLRHYPLDVLKLDRSFVHGITRRAEDERIVAAMIGLAHDLGLHVVAEGVETPAQRELLRRLNCDAAQGYLYSEPLSSSAAADYLKAAAPV
jgi:predicted signal transduction protein with EAL and GGDEF domain